MKRKRNESEERRVEESLAHAGRDISPPPEPELRVMARSAAESPRMPPASATRRPLWRPLHLRWAAVVAAALLAGSGFGFGLGSREASDGAAGTKLVGFGFLPAKGWTVVQSGTVGATGGATAVAANVPLSRDDDAREIPYATLESLPARGVLIRALFTARGDPGEDMRFPVRKLPLRIAAAARISSSSEGWPIHRRLAQYRLRAAVGGYNVEARMYFGSVPAPEMIEAAQRQLNRLVVASERVTIAARPTIVRLGELVSLFGSVDSPRGDEIVTIQAKDCRQQFFRDFLSARTREGGAWSTQTWSVAINTTLRAVWNGHTSAEIFVRKRAGILLRQRSPRRFSVSVQSHAGAMFWRKPFLFQRFDRRLGTWVTVRRVVLTESDGSTTFTASVPKGSLVRAVIPLSQARPCYAAGYSPLLRT
jgi:hypothetical protein